MNKILEPDGYTVEEQGQIADWIERHGVPEWVACGPIEIDGRRLKFNVLPILRATNENADWFEGSYDPQPRSIVIEHPAPDFLL